MFHTRARTAITLLGTVIGLSACGGSAAPVAPASSASGFTSGGDAAVFGGFTKQQPLLFVADAGNDVVDVFAENNPAKPIAVISQGISNPEEMAVDGGGKLYVANLQANDVTVYAPPYTGAPVTTYSQGLTYPFSVTVASDGTVYVSANPNGNVGQIVVYPPHRTSPSRTLSIAGYIEGVTLDASGNLYAAYNTPSGVGRVRKYEGGVKPGTDLPLKLGLVSGLAFDGAGNIAIENQIAATVDIFGLDGTSPKQVFNNGGNGFGDPVSIAFDQSHGRLYVGDGQNDVVDVVSYPSGTTQKVISKSFGRVHGVALSPAAQP
jgi:hypothetical protein